MITRERLKKLCEKDDVFEAVSSALYHETYQAALVLEKLEHMGLVFGNGHHMAQKIAEFATNLLDERWTGETKGKDDG